MPDRVVVANVFEKNIFSFVRDVPAGTPFRIAETGHSEIYVKLSATTIRDNANKGVNCIQIGTGLMYLRWNTRVQQLEVE